MAFPGGLGGLAAVREAERFVDPTTTEVLAPLSGAVRDIRQDELQPAQEEGGFLAGLGRAARDVGEFVLGTDARNRARRQQSQQLEQAQFEQQRLGRLREVGLQNRRVRRLLAAGETEAGFDALEELIGGLEGAGVSRDLVDAQLDQLDEEDIEGLQNQLRVLDLGMVENGVLDRDTDLDPTREMLNQERQQAVSNEMAAADRAIARDRLELDTLLGTEGLELDREVFDFDMQMRRAGATLDERRLALETRFGQQRIDNARRQIDVTQELGLGRIALDDRIAREQTRLAEQGLDLDQQRIRLEDRFGTARVRQADAQIRLQNYRFQFDQNQANIANALRQQEFDLNSEIARGNLGVSEGRLALDQEVENRRLELQAQGLSLDEQRLALEERFGAQRLAAEQARTNLAAQQATRERLATTAGLRQSYVEVSRSLANAQSTVEAIRAEDVGSTLPTTGLFGYLVSFVPGTGAANIENLIERIKADAGLQQIIALKNAGGTLGQVSNLELQALQNSLARLTSFQGRDQYEAELNRFMQQYAQSVANIQEALVTRGIAQGFDITQPLQGAQQGAPARRPASNGFSIDEDIAAELGGG